jgi:hypothetical protein
MQKYTGWNWGRAQSGSLLGPSLVLFIHRSIFFLSPQGAMLSHKQKKKQGKASALCCFAVLICAACVYRGIAEVVALLGFIQRGLYCSIFS